ncbi:hypothetical protein ACTOB_005470 [Actinoplanes oblitus]|uniref:DUF1109 domain-containing protein n=1 Tax=Actinoplanes oblitus TaxID=3040509 RepID=A0ABY8W6Q1_9ACTN|nr:hypothetical protein [Actinoplanes oblitus]WIM93490.1 hypothetical protein ACTOB_005470 [Actinoplanes oblitus]
MTFLWDLADRDAEDPGPAPARRTAPWSRRGLVHLALGCSGWLLLVPVLRLALSPSFGGSYLALALWFATLLLAASVSITAVLIACLRRSWAVAALSLVLAAAGVIATTRQPSPLDYVDYQYRTHRAAFAGLAEDYRAGRLDREGDLVLPAELRPLCPTGFAYAGPTAVFIQIWQDWRAEAGTGLAYYPGPPDMANYINTAPGGQGLPRREVGDGWWWVTA